MTTDVLVPCRLGGSGRAGPGRGRVGTWFLPPCRILVLYKLSTCVRQPDAQYKRCRSAAAAENGLRGEAGSLNRGSDGYGCETVTAVADNKSFRESPGTAAAAIELAAAAAVLYRPRDGDVWLSVVGW